MCVFYTMEESFKTSQKKDLERSVVAWEFLVEKLHEQRCAVNGMGRDLWIFIILPEYERHMLLL